MTQKCEGQRVPKVIFRTRAGGESVDVNRNDICKGRTLVVFSLLAYINPNARPKARPNALKPQSIGVITKPGCPFCAKAKEMLTGNGMAYEEIVLGQDASLRSVRAMTGKETVPQVFPDGDHIGGSEELEGYIRGSSRAAA